MASLEIRGDVYHLRYRDKRGRSRSVTTKLHVSPKNEILARKMLQRLEVDIERGKYPVPSVKIGTLLDDVLRDYTVNGKKSLRTTKDRIEKHLRPFFGEMKVDKFGADDWREYVEARQKADAANATINHERAALIRAFSLHKQAGKLDSVPYIPRLAEPAPRADYIDRAELEALCRHLPPYLASAARFAFLTGWRLGEIRGLQWRHVDFVRGEIRLEPGATKNGEGRVFPMTAELRTLLETSTRTLWSVQATESSVVEEMVPTLTPFVFHIPNGRPIGYIYHSWQRACRAIGKPGLLFHGLRRSFVREQRLKGMSESEIMKLTGHLTRSVFDRYNVIDSTDLNRLKAIMEGHMSALGSDLSRSRQ